MPVDFLGDPQRAQRLRLGQGVRGGGAALGGLGAPSSAPPIPVTPVRRPPHPLTAQPPQRPLYSPLAVDVTPQRPVASNMPLPSLEGRGRAMLARGFPNIVQNTIDRQAQLMGPGVRKSLEMLRDPD